MSEVLTESPGDEFSVGSSDDTSTEAVEPVAEQTDAAEQVEAEPQATPQYTEIPDEWREEAQAIADARFQALLAEAAQQYGQNDETEDGEFQLDPFADDYGQNLQGMIQQNNQQLLGQIQQIVAPLMQNMEQQASEEGQQLLRDALADVTTRTGDFHSDKGKAAAEKVFDLYKNDAAQRYGVSNRALEYAAGQAASFVREIEQAAWEAGRESYKNERATLVNAPRDAGAGASGVRVNPGYDGLDELGIADRWVEPA